MTHTTRKDIDALLGAVVFVLCIFSVQALHTLSMRDYDSAHRITSPWYTYTHARILNVRSNYYESLRAPQERVFNTRLFQEHEHMR